MMGWEIHPAKTAFPRFTADWDRLNNDLYKGHPLFDSRFVGPLLECFGSGQEKLCLYRSADVIVGALILKPDGIGRWSSFHPSQAQATPVLISDANLLKSLIKVLPGFSWAIELFAVDPRFSPDFAQLNLIKIVSANARTIGIHPELSFPEYWEQRPKNLKANVRRYVNRAEKEGAIPSLLEFKNEDEMPPGVTRFGELESAGWKGAAGTAVSSENRQGYFYSKVLKGFAQSSQASIYELHFDEQLAASRLVISSDGMLVILKTTYDETLARFAPGRILLHRIIQQQLDGKSGNTLEFYTNATRDQAEWTTFGCTIQNIQLFGHDYSAAAFQLLKVLQRHLRGAKHQSERVTGLIPVTMVQSAASIEALLAKGYELDEFAARESIEDSADWFSLLHHQVYPQDPGVRFYFVAEGQLPSTIFPLRLTDTGRTKTVEGLANYYTSLYSPLQTEDSNPFALSEILARATNDHGGAHVMRFAPMNPDSRVYQDLIDGLEDIGWIPFRFFCFGNWFLKAPDTWESYLKQRSANLRSTIKRMNKKLSADNGSLEIASSPEHIDEAVDAFQAVYSASWKIPEPYPNFVPSLIRRLAELGMLRLGIARLQGRPIAAQLWIVGQDKASIYKVAYHEDFAAYSPGTVLTAHLMQHVIEQDHVKEVDFLIGDDKYKQIWMSDRRERWGIVAYNPRTLIGFALFLKEVLARATKSLRTRLSRRLKREDPASQTTRK